MAAAINGGLAVSSLGLWVLAQIQGLTWQADFTAFYTGWSLVVNGNGMKLYDYEVQAAIQQQLLAGRHLAGGLLAYNYPPHVALVFSPLAYLPLNQSYLAWSVLQSGLLVALSWMLWRHLRAEGVPVFSRYLIISATLALPSIGTTVLLGAFSTLMLLCLLSFALTLRQNRDIQSGLWVVLMTFKPQVAVIPGMVLVASRRWKAVATLLGCGLLIFISTGLGLGFDVWTSFARSLFVTFEADLSLGVAPSSMYNLRGLLVSVFGDESTAVVNVISLLVFVASVLFTFWLWSGAVSKRVDFDLRMSITLLSGVLFNLHVNPQDGVLLVASALFFWHHLRHTGQATTVFGALAMICPMVFWLTERVLPHPALPTPPLVMLGLGVWMLREMLR